MMLCKFKLHYIIANRHAHSFSRTTIETVSIFLQISVQTLLNLSPLPRDSIWATETSLMSFQSVMFIPVVFCDWNLVFSILNSFLAHRIRILYFKCSIKYMWRTLTCFPEQNPAHSAIYTKEYLWTIKTRFELF